jgi:hypothetical protein
MLSPSSSMIARDVDEEQEFRAGKLYSCQEGDSISQRQKYKRRLVISR